VPLLLLAYYAYLGISVWLNDRSTGRHILAFGVIAAAMSVVVLVLWRFAGAGAAAVTGVLVFGLMTVVVVFENFVARLARLASESTPKAIAFGVAVVGAAITALSLPGNIAQISSFLLQARNDPCVQQKIADGTWRGAAIWECVMGPWPTPTRP
jgi:hypothetical protein